MGDAPYPFGDALIPEETEEHTVLFLVRPADAPTFTDEELDRLQEEHLTHLRDLRRRGVILANGPLSDQSDERLRGLSVYAAPLEEALALARQDPMVKARRLAVEGARWMTQTHTVHFGITTPRPSEPDEPG